MTKRYRILGHVIDLLALIIVANWFLRFIGVGGIGRTLSNVLDLVLIAILAIEYIYRLKTSTQRKVFLRESWPELISLVPFVPIFRLFRLFKIINKSRVKGFGRFVHKLLRNNGLYYVIGVVVLLAVLGGGLLYKVEPQGVESYKDGIWLAFVTMTTVGYGDIVPTTQEGRLISMLLMIVGIGFLSVLTGSIASFFTKHRTVEKNKKTTKATLDLSDLSTDEVEKVRAFVGYLKSTR